MDNIDSLYVVRMKLNDGDLGKYKDVCNKVIVKL